MKRYKTNILFSCSLLMILFFQLHCSKKDDSRAHSNMGNTTNGLSVSDKMESFQDFMSDSSLIEQEFAKSLSTNGSSIKLIGFKTIDLSEDEVKEMKTLIINNKEKFSKKNNYFFSEKGKFIRVYFPLHTALILLNGTEYIANELGVIELDANMSVNDLLLMGRKKSQLVRGTGTNKIQGDKILLNHSLHFYRSNVDQNAYIFDLGKRSFGINKGHSCCGSQQKVVDSFNGDEKSLTLPIIVPNVVSDDGKVSCYQNHGNQNCSTAFGINEGRCGFQATICMDYNGWFTNCVNGSVLNFPGSDCDYAMGRGHCWNELM